MWAMVKATEEKKWSHSRVNSFLASYLAGSQAPRSQLELKGGEQRGSRRQLRPPPPLEYSPLTCLGHWDDPTSSEMSTFSERTRGQVTRNGPVRFSKEAKSQCFLRNCLFLKYWSLVQFFQSTPWAKRSPPP